MIARRTPPLPDGGLPFHLLMCEIPSMNSTLNYLTDEHGERTAVVVPLSEFEKLMEDLEDLAVVAERRDEPVLPHDQFVAELKRDGIL